jgi:quinolinate synthase
MCKYMKSNSLEDILRVLVKPRPEDRVEIDPAVRERALHSINEMFRYTDMAVARNG